MKKLLLIMFTAILSLGASAQLHGYRGKRYYAPVTRVYVSPFSYGFGFGYPYFGYPYFGYPYYGYPYYPYDGYRRMPYKLSLQIDKIKSDYRHKIKSTRHDKSLSPSQRRQEIRSLKSERDKAVFDAQMNYSPRQNKQNPGMNQQLENNDSSSGDNLNQGTKF